MPIELIQILAQFPIVVIFVWYSDRMYRQFQDFLREERAARCAQMKELGDKIDDLKDAIK